MQKFIVGLAFSLGLTTPAHAIDASGAEVLTFVNVHNTNCSPWGQDHVVVNIWDPDQPGSITEPNQCTHTKVALKHNETKTVLLKGRVEGTVPDGGAHYSHNCVYKHEADGTAGGARDVHGDQQSGVTCRNDWIGVCQCTKD